MHNLHEYQPSNSDIDLKATEYQPESSGINYPLSTIEDQIDTIPKLCFVEAAITESKVEILPTRYFLNEPPGFFEISFKTYLQFPFNFTTNSQRTHQVCG